jgi:hypothetical protein
VDGNDIHDTKWRSTHQYLRQERTSRLYIYMSKSIIPSSTIKIRCTFWKQLASVASASEDRFGIQGFGLETVVLGILGEPSHWNNMGVL